MAHAGQPRLNRPNDQLVQGASILEPTFDGHIDEPASANGGMRPPCRQWPPAVADASSELQSARPPMRRRIRTRPVRHECRIGGQGRQNSPVARVHRAGAPMGMERVAMRVLIASACRSSSAMSPIRCLAAGRLSRNGPSSVEGEATGGNSR